MELISKLQQTGLTEREAEVYIALLQKNEFTAPELAKITTITRTKIYEILQNLIHKGACNESYKNGQKIYRAIEPRLALQNIISNYEIEFEQKKKIEVEQRQMAALELEKSLAALNKNKKGNPCSLDSIEILTDRKQISDRWLAIQTSTKKELVGFSKPPYANMNDNLRQETEIINHHIKVKSIYEYNGLMQDEIENLLRVIDAYQEIGEEARIIKELPMKLVISDDSISMFTINNNIPLKSTITAIMVNHAGFAKAHKEVFESYWQKSISIKDFKRDIKKYLNHK